jgi:hypothetical protein
MVFWLMVVVAAGVLLLVAPSVRALQRDEERPMTAQASDDLPYPRAHVWQAYWAHTRFHGPVHYIDEARAGDVVDMEQVVSDGPRSEISRTRVRIDAIEPGHSVRLSPLSQDGAPYPGGAGCWEALTFEAVDAVTTRVTSTLHATRRVPLQRLMMRQAIQIDLRKLRQRLEDGGAVPLAPLKPVAPAN